MFKRYSPNFGLKLAAKKYTSGGEVCQLHDIYEDYCNLLLT